jgi:hypothetical protein
MITKGVLNNFEVPIELLCNWENQSLNLQPNKGIQNIELPILLASCLFVHFINYSIKMNIFNGIILWLATLQWKWFFISLCAILRNVQKLKIWLPQKENLLKIMFIFKELCGFQLICGAIDCMHMYIKNFIDAFVINYLFIDAPPSSSLGPKWVQLC